MGWRKFKGQSVFHVILFSLVIYFVRVLVAYFPSEEISSTFAANFIEWFGVLYGILLPLILVRVWEQLDDIDREFDREADTIRILYEDLSFLGGENKKTGREISALLRKYVRHVIKNYHIELKEPIEKKISAKESLIKNGYYVGGPAAQNNGKTIQNVRRVGDEILSNIRGKFTKLIDPKRMGTPDAEFIVKELFQKLNEIVDIRGDRIGFASQRLFQTLKIVALITSMMFLIPFYIVGYLERTSLLDNILILGLTLLVIFIYMIIEDFDEPFGGTWKIDDESWYLVRLEMVCEERQLQLENRKRKSNVDRGLRRYHHHHRSEYHKRHAEMRRLTKSASRQIEQTKVSTVKSSTKTKTKRPRSTSKSKSAIKPVSASSKQKRSRKTKSQ